MRRAGLTLGLAFGVSVAALGVLLGPTGLRAPWHADPLLWSLRAPRVALAAVAGGSLALAGAGMQTLLRNDLAEPYILGLSGGAALGSVLSSALFPEFPTGLLGALGALAAALLVRALARGSYDPSRLLLSGVSVGSLLFGITGLLLIVAPSSQLLRGSMFWLFGGLGAPEWRTLLVPALALVAVHGWLLARAERLDRLMFGDDVASALGVGVVSLKRGLLFACVLLTATSVGVSGLIGFVGLVAPHLARRFFGASHRAFLPLAAFSGAVLLMAADLVARTAFAPREVPVGLITASLGAPFFLWHLHRGTA